jgi:hypothetical protein
MKVPPLCGEEIAYRRGVVDPDKRATERKPTRPIGLSQEGAHTMPRPTTPETGEQVPVRPHDSGSAANETVDGLDATTEALRRAAEDTPSAADPDDVEKTPVFDRAGQAPKI